jgi:hypothetical protein
MPETDQDAENSPVDAKGQPLAPFPSLRARLPAFELAEHASRRPPRSRRILIVSLAASDRAAAPSSRRPVLPSRRRPRTLRIPILSLAASKRAAVPSVCRRPVVPSSRHPVLPSRRRPRTLRIPSYRSPHPNVQQFRPSVVVPASRAPQAPPTASSVDDRAGAGNRAAPLMKQLATLRAHCASSRATEPRTQRSNADGGAGKTEGCLSKEFRYDASARVPRWNAHPCSPGGASLFAAALSDSSHDGTIRKKGGPGGAALLVPAARYA